MKELYVGWYLECEKFSKTDIIEYFECMTDATHKVRSGDIFCSKCGSKLFLQRDEESYYDSFCRYSLEEFNENFTSITPNIYNNSVEYIISNTSKGRYNNENSCDSENNIIIDHETCNNIQSPFTEEFIKKITNLVGYSSVKVKFGTIMFDF